MTIQDNVCAILEKRFGIPRKFLIEEYFSCPLTYHPFFLDSIQMAYFFELEQVYGCISIDSVLNKGLFTINDTVNTIRKINSN